MKKLISFIGVFGLAILLSGCDYQVPVQPNDQALPDANPSQEIEKNEQVLPPTNNEDENLVPEDIIEEPISEVNVEDIRKAFSKKYPNIDYSKHIITIENSQNGKYAEGGVGAPEGGGAHYWATKADGDWIIVVEAQDSVACSIFEPYSFPEEMIKNCIVDETDDDITGVYQGLIKRYPDELLAGDNSHYIELSDGTKKNIKVCDKRVMKLSDQINILADTDNKVTIYSDRVERSASCVNGMVLELGDENTKYSGVIKKVIFPVQGYAYHIESSDGVRKQIQICDKRITGIWDTVIDSMISSSSIDLYSNSTSQSGLCVNGVVVNL